MPADCLGRGGLLRMRCASWSALHRIFHLGSLRKIGFADEARPQSDLDLLREAQLPEWRRLARSGLRPSSKVMALLTFADMLRGCDLVHMQSTTRGLSIPRVPVGAKRSCPTMRKSASGADLRRSW